MVGRYPQKKGWLMVGDDEKEATSVRSCGHLWTFNLTEVHQKLTDRLRDVKSQTKVIAPCTPCRLVRILRWVKLRRMADTCRDHRNWVSRPEIGYPKMLFFFNCVPKLEIGYLTITKLCFFFHVD